MEKCAITSSITAVGTLDKTPTKAQTLPVPIVGYTLLAAVNFNQMDKEQELQEIAETLMQSENLAASVEILRQFADKCWQEGACEAQNDAAKYINEHTVNYRDIPNVLFTNGGRF